MGFWAEKINGVPSTTPAPPTSRNLFGLYTNPVPQPQTVPVQQSYTPSVRLTQGSTCPGCGSDRYMGSYGDRAVGCGDCGYHPRFEQSGYGMPSLPGDRGPVKAARQIATDGFTLKGAVAELNAGGGTHI